MKMSKINILKYIIHSLILSSISSPTHPLGYTEEHAQSCAPALHSWGRCGSVELLWSPQGRCDDLPPGTSCNNTAVWPPPLCCHGELSLHLAHWRNISSNPIGEHSNYNVVSIYSKVKINVAFFYTNFYRIQVFQCMIIMKSIFMKVWVLCMYFLSTQNHILMVFI